MKISLLIFFISIFSIFSCSHNNTYEESKQFTINDFNKSEDLKGVILNFDSMIMRPTGLMVTDSFLIIIEPSMDKLFTIFNLKDKKAIGKRINKGQGPEDMIRPRFLGAKANVIQIMDMATSTMFEYEKTEFINNTDPKPIYRIKLEYPIFIDAEIVNNNIVGFFDDNLYQLKLFDLQGKEFSKFAPFPTSNIPFTEMEKKEVFYMNFTTNGIDKIVLCYYMTDLIEIYNIDGSLKKRLHGPDQFISRVKEYHDGEISGSSPVKGSNRDAFFSPEKAGDEFFVLYNGGSIDDLGHSSSCNQLFTFTWDGTPQKIYNLNNPIFSFTVDEINKTIYGISNTPEYHIVEYKYK